MTMTALAKRVRSKRRTMGLSQRGLDALAGLAGGHVWAIEAGKRTDLQSSTLTALALALGVTETWLLTGRDEHRLVSTHSA